ncbi:TraB/GumN family protein [Phenylobacterium sp.]|jgi:uncharacterized protein YbaP (TraB family)|uniref:TraB/GumN family protein n=1 Tax=Phenylobacterium sp. TaxID=1871053 RepID=UPI002F91F2FF
MNGLLAGIAALLLLASPAQAKPPVWVVSDGDSEMVLFGSVHILPPGVDWMPAELAAALKTADDVWFETTVGSAADREMSDLAIRLGRADRGLSLSQLLSRRDAARLKRVAAAYDLDMALLDGLKPWLAEAFIVQEVLARDSKASTAYGVEDAVDAAAPPQAKRQVFATSAEHIAILAGAPLDEQLASLRATLKSLKPQSKDFERMLQAWMKGDLRWLQRNAIDPERRLAPAQFKRLVTDRNARWTATLDQRLKGRGRTVVVVGMGHLIGRDGLPARLRALGYSVKGP